MGYLATPALGDTPRSRQARILDSPGIIDAVPQGSAIRFAHDLLIAEESKILDERLNGAMVHPVPSTLEDSFMLLLHTHVAGEGRRGINVPESASSVQDSMNSVVIHDDQPIIQTEPVSRFFGDFIAVNDVCFPVKKGEVFGSLGPNGAGKGFIISIGISHANGPP